MVAISIETTSDWRFDWLGGRAIRHFGKISYGIYVYHYFVRGIVDAHWHSDWVHGYLATRLVRFCVLVAMSVGIAEVSWYVIEKPVMQLKDKFS